MRLTRTLRRFAGVVWPPNAGGACNLTLPVERLEGRALFSSIASLAAEPFVGPVGLATSSVNTLPEKRVARTIVITPAGLALVNGATHRYSVQVFDQHGDEMPSPPALTWAVRSGGVGGSIDGDGLFTAPAAGTGTSVVDVASGIASASVAVSTAAIADDGSSAQQPVTGVYRIATRGQPAMSLDVGGFGNADGTPVVLWTANQTSNQQWLVQAQGDGSYAIYAYSGENSLQMLDLTSGDTANGTLVNTYHDNGTPAQRWLFVPVGGGYFRIVPKNGENTLQTLDIQNGNDAGLGSRANVYTYWGGDNQVFSLQPPGPLQVPPNAKKGLAGWLGESANVHNGWGYDWGSGGAVPAGVEYDPMSWGYYGNADNGFVDWLNGLKANGAKYVMGFNEPDSTTQANLSVAGALEAWGLMQGLGLSLVSPACVHADDDWMRQFMAGAAARGYRVDAVAVHWYGGADPQGFINYVNAIHDLYGKPVWVTEFAPADWSGHGGISVTQATSFMQTVVPQLNAMSFVQRYSWFSANADDASLGSGALFNGDGSLTPLGVLYSRL